MKGITNYAKINDKGKLEIHTDNATFVNCETSTQIGENDAYTIFGKDLLQLYAILQDKKVMAIRGLRNGTLSHTDIIVVGENAEALKIKADAEAYYNRTVSASLSTNLVNMKALDKWDGKTPVVSSGSGTFIDASSFVK